MKETIIANKLVLVDDHNRERIILSAGHSGSPATIDIYGEEDSAIKLWVDIDQAPKLVFQRKDGRHMVTFALLENGEPVLTFYDRDGKPMLRMGKWDRDSIPTIDIFAGGEPQWSTAELRKGRRKKGS